MARSRRAGLRFGPSLDFARSRWCACLWLWRHAHASHLAVISAVHLAKGQGRGLGLAHRLEPGSIVSLAIISQVTKSASAFARAFLAMLVLELEDMVVRLVRLSKFAGVHGYRWTVSRLTSAVPSGACLGARGFGVAAKAGRGQAN